MKRKAAVLAVVVALAVGLAANAKDKAKDEKADAGKAASAGSAKVYANSDFKFELKYSDDWNATENKLGGGSEDLNSKLADMSTKMKGMPGMAGLPMTMPQGLAVCFNKGKKCDSVEKETDPNAQLMIMDLNTLPVVRGKKSKPNEVEKPEPKMAKAECETIERTNVKWGGASAPWTTIRCPEKKKWRYNTTVLMQRAAGKAKNQYTLMCSMRSDSKDKDESLTEFQAQLKPRCQQMVSTTQFKKK